MRTYIGPEASHAWLAHVRGHIETAIKELEIALKSERDHPDALLLLAHCLLRAGLMDPARPVIEHVMAVDPLTPLTRCFPGYLAAMEGRFDDAVAPYQDMLDGDPANPVARLFSLWANLAAGRQKAAIALADDFAGPTEHSTPAFIARQLVAAHLSRIESLSIPEPILEATKGSEMYSRHAAEAWAIAGDAAQAAAWLDRAVDLGFFNWPYLAGHSPFLAAVRETPDVKSVLNKAKARWEAALEMYR